MCIRDRTTNGGLWSGSTYIQPNGDFIVPNSPVDAWIKGNHQPPYDHKAPRNFGVEYTIVSRDTGLLQGGNPEVTLIGHRLDRDDNVIPEVLKGATQDYINDLSLKVDDMIRLEQNKDLNEPLVNNSEIRDIALEIRKIQGKKF